MLKTKLLTLAALSGLIAFAPGAMADRDDHRYDRRADRYEKRIDKHDRRSHHPADRHGYRHSDRYRVGKHYWHGRPHHHGKKYYRPYVYVPDGYRWADDGWWVLFGYRD